MPYPDNQSLPAAIKDKYGPRCSRAFRHAWNSVYDKTGDEGRAFAAAHAAAKRCQEGGTKGMTSQLAARKLPALGPGGFRFVTNALTGAQTPDGGRRRFKAIASSSITDYAGNTISLSALEGMAEDFRKGVTIFMNHDYTVPDSVFGTSDSAEVRDSGERDAKGSAIYDLHIGGTVNEPNPKAIQLHDSIVGNYVKFGASIGAIVGEHKRDPETGGLQISSLSAKEASIVGIGKNQRSWVTKAVSSLDELTEVPEDFADEEPEPQALVSALPTEELLTAGDTCPTCKHSSACDCGDCDCANEMHKGVKNELPAESLQAEAIGGPSLITLGEAGPETVTLGVQESDDAETPETAPVLDATEPAGPKVVNVEEEDMASLAAHIRGLVEAIGKRDEEIATLKAELSAKQKVVAEVEETKTAVARLMELPLQRKAVLTLENHLDRFPMLDPRIISHLNRGNE